MTATEGVVVLGTRARAARAGFESKVTRTNDSKNIAMKRKGYASISGLIMA
jgi:hypothetical protein